MNIEQQRAAFEAAYIGASSLRLEDIDLEYDDAQKRYLDDQAQSTWEGWQMAIALDRQGRGEPVVGEQFMRAWINLNALPGTMMVGPEGRFGPIAASTSCWITTSESEAERLKAKGPVLEVWTTSQLAHPAVKESLTAAEPVDIPAGWKEQFKAELYVRYCAMDNQDFPLEDYPAVALEVFEKVVGPRHPTVIRWRNDAITQCIAIAYKYCRDPESHRYLKQDLEALLTAAQQPAEPDNPDTSPLSGKGPFKTVDALMDALNAEPMKVVSDEELIAFGGEEQFFLFCDEDEFLDIAKSVLSRFGQPAQPAASAEPVAIRIREKLYRGTDNGWTYHPHFNPTDRWTKEALRRNEWQSLYTAPVAAQPSVPEINLSNAPSVLNTNDKAMWALGWNDCREAMLKGQK